MTRSKQHVGAQSDALEADPALEAARAAQRAALAAIKPRAATGRKYAIGDGDTCPLVREHGAMFVLQGQPPKQFCPDQSHDMAGTPAIWPYHHLDEAVTMYKAAAKAGQVDSPAEGLAPLAAAPLPDLDIGDLNA